MMTNSQMINKLIDDEWEAIDGYNKYLNDIEKKNPALVDLVTPTVESIIDDERRHVRTLQKLKEALKLSAPSGVAE